MFKLAFIYINRPYWRAGMQSAEDWGQCRERKLDLDFIWNGATYILRARSMETFIISDSSAQNVPATLSGEVCSVAPALMWASERQRPVIQSPSSEARLLRMNVDLSRPSCLYSDPSVYVKTEYDTGNQLLCLTVVIILSHYWRLL